MDKRQINANADALFNSDRVQKIAKKYQYRTTAERLAPFRSLFVFFSYLLQVLSALLAAGGVLVLSQMFAASFVIVGGITVILLLLLEAAKRLSYDTLNTQRIAGEKINKAVLLFCVLFAGCSVLSSKLGAPYTVEFFAVAPSIADTSAIKAEAQIKATASAAYWQQLSNQAKAEADRIHAANNWRGVTSRNARPAQLAAVQRAAAYKDSLIKSAQIIQADLRQNIKKAEATHAEQLATFRAWRSSFAFWVAWLSVAFELSFFASLWFLANYDGRLLLEFKASKEPIKDKVKDKVKRVKDTVKDTVKEAVFNSQDAAPIGFNKQDKVQVKDGVIIPPVPPKKAPRVQIVIDGGKVKQYTLGGLRNLIKASKPERAAELSQYIKKLKNYE